MPATRKPNSGPYVVSWKQYDGVCLEQECHTWDDACRFMRQLLIDGCEITSVRFC